jgi:hypothetical protein
MEFKGNAQAEYAAAMTMNHGFEEFIEAPHFTYSFECIGADGKVKWTETIRNLVVTVGKNDLLDKYFAGSAYTAAFKLGLKGPGVAVAGDTLASHPSWAEVNPYTGNRPALTWAAASSGSKSATTVSFAITVAGPTTVAGGFITDQATGAVGLLYSAGDLTTPRSVLSGDTLNMTLTVQV